MKDCIIMKLTLTLTLTVTMTLKIFGQSYAHEQSSSYIEPDDPAVRAKLSQWRDLKFGILMHWGLYSVPGICESWTITSEDWITPDTTRTYEEYKQWYWGLINEFNPSKFNPEQWAKTAKSAGMRYMVFTTKHHDGFCLFDSKETDFTVTHSRFGNNPKSNVARYIFDAFRNEGLMTGAYFSKPDWHCPYYWWPSRATSDRMHNYPISQYPERWNRYKSFVFNQVNEITSNYGPLDILWLDGGWCTPPREDINLDSIVGKARENQPGLIVVDRACPGKHENYQTPEQKIPDHQILTPWESCISLTNDWGWVPKPTFKSAGTIISMLCEIVAKGGSMLLGVGPTPDGLIEDESVSRLEAIGQWLSKNGEAIYGTVPTPIYINKEGDVWFTGSKDHKYTYALIPLEGKPVVSTVSWEGNIPKKGCRIIDLDGMKSVKYKVSNNQVTIILPLKSMTSTPAIALKFENQ